MAAGANPLAKMLARNDLRFMFNATKSMKCWFRT